jgi:uncharacterized membrane protein
MKDQLKYFIVLLTIMMSSCNNDVDIVPVGVMSKEKMVEVMAEIELTQALIKLKSSTKDTVNEGQLYNEVYTTYSISEEEFNNSLEHYCKDPGLLMDMYGKVIENLTKKQSEQQRK